MDGYTYKGYNIYLAEHPKLYGKYEVYKSELFVSRALTLQEAKSVINKVIYEILPKIKTQGGKRKGSGAKPKYNELTKVVTFRCPISKVDDIKGMVTAKLAEWSIRHIS